MAVSGETEQEQGTLREGVLTMKARIHELELSVSPQAAVPGNLEERLNALDNLWRETRMEIGHLRNELEQLRSSVEEFVGTVEAREVTSAEAKSLLLSRIGSNEVFYPSDLAAELGLDLKTVMEAVQELIKEGKLQPPHH